MRRAVYIAGRLNGGHDEFDVHCIVFFLNLLLYISFGFFSLLTGVDHSSNFTYTVMWSNTLSRRKKYTSMYYTYNR